MTRRNLDSGESITQPFGMVGDSLLATIRGPNGEEASVSGKPFRGENVYQYGDTFQPGAYDLQVPTQEGDLKSFAFYVRHDPAESDLASMTSEDWQSPLIAEVIRAGIEPLSVPEDQRFIAPPQPIWEQMLLVLIGILLLERLLAIWITKRRVRRSAPVVLEA